MTSLKHGDTSEPQVKTGQIPTGSDPAGPLNLIPEHSPGLSPPKEGITGSSTQKDDKNFLQIPQRPRSKKHRSKRKKKHYGAVRERLPKTQEYIRKSVKFKRYRFLILGLTFFAYTTYHLSRKPISVVKSVLHINCTNGSEEIYNCTSWAPFDHDNYSSLEGSLDYAFLFAYAIGMFVSGHVAERVNLRYFLTFGMLASGLFTALFGFGFYWKIHSLGYYISMQVAAGFVSSTGWPGVVTVMGNWFGKGKRGLIMGVWNSHTSVGNILGSLIAGVFVNYDWGLSFIVPGAIIGGMGIIIFFTLVPKPSDIGCPAPDHHGPRQVEEPPPILSEAMTSEVEPLVQNDDDEEGAPKQEEEKAISFYNALKIPGVAEFAMCLFFAKLVSYTFLFWLPNYISHTGGVDATIAADLSTLFDVGGIVGGIAAGLISDYTKGRATTCIVMLLLAAPMMFIYESYATASTAANVSLLLITGAFVNGPYALITTAVSADLGTHPSLKGDSRALATVTAIIDGTGSMGAALGPLLTGLISKHGWHNVFYMLIFSDVCAMLLLIRLVLKECGCPIYLGSRRHMTPPMVSPPDPS